MGAGGAVRPLWAGDEEAVVDAVVASGLFARPDEPFLRQLLLDHLSGADTTSKWLVHASPEVVGTALARAVEATEGCWDLTMLAVHPHSQGRGVAAGLVTAVEEDLRHTAGRIVRVETSSDPAQAPAQRLYRRLGYLERGRIPGWWGPDDDLVLFSKAL